MLEEGKPSGHSPQTGALSECDSCPQGEPYRYFLFPRSEVIRVTGPPYNNVIDIAITNARTQVKTAEGKTDPVTAGNAEWALYDLSAGLEPKSVFFSDHYWFAHEKLSAEGKIKHPVAACPDRLKPTTVRAWSPQEGWKTILVPPVQSHAPKS